MSKDSTSWGSVANWYDDVIEDTDSYQQQVLLPNLKRLLQLKKSDAVLDVACGTGFFTNHFAQEATAVGVDVGEELLEIARKKYPQIQFFATGADDLSQFADGSFSKITIVLAIQNIEPVHAMMKEMYRVLAVGGSVHVVMNHPAFRIPQKSSWQWDEENKQQYRRVDAYVHEFKSVIDMHPGKKDKKQTVSFHRPLQYYFKVFSNTGFLVGRLEEWISHKASQKGPRQQEEDRTRKEIPLFLYLELRKV